jgi:hypothetical protein
VSDETPSEMSDEALLRQLMENFGLSHEMALREVAVMRGRPYDDVIEVEEAAS